MLNRKKGRNALEKGFTLVELMIVIVIVGILSAVALPNFLSQTDKAKGTECTSLASALMGEVAAEALANNAAAFTAFSTASTGTLAVATTNSSLCTFGTGLSAAPATTYTMTAVGKAGLTNYAAKFCVNYKTGKKASTIKTDGTAIASVAAPSC